MSVSESGEMLTSLTHSHIIPGAVNPDIIIGIVNGEVVSSHPYVIITDNPDYLKIRFMVANHFVEVRYCEEIFSRYREIRTLQSIREASGLAKKLREQGERKYIEPKRKQRDRSGSIRRARSEEKISIARIIEQLRKWKWEVGDPE